MNRDTARVVIKTPPPGPNARRWADFHRKYAARSTYHEGFIWDRSRPAIGPFCTDVDGNVILDFVSHVAGSALGYNHPELVRVASKLQGIDPDRYAGCDFIGAWGPDPAKSEIPTPSHLHYKLMEITAQFGFGSAFFPIPAPRPWRTPSRSATTIERTTVTGSASTGLSMAAPWALFP